MNLEEKVQIIKWIYGGNSQNRVVRELFPAKFPDRQVPRQCTVSKLVSRFEQTGSVLPRKRTGRPKSATTEETSIDLIAAIKVQPHSSLRQISLEAGVSVGSIHTVFHKAKFHPYKMQFHQELSDGDEDRRIEFCEWAQQQCNANAVFLNNLCMSDESQFRLTGEVNTQNCKYWSDTNPHWMAETHTQRPEKLNVWAGICRGRIIGPFFLPPILNGESYLNLLVHSVGPSLDAIAGEDPIWFQHDGAPPHFARAVREYLNATFPEPGSVEEGHKNGLRDHQI